MKYDLVVAGGGPGGVSAAIAAARMGVRVLLIERYGFLGGMGTSGLVAPFMTFFAGENQLVKGIFQEIIDELTKLDAFGGEGNPLSFDGEVLKFVLDRLCLDAGVMIRFHSFVSGVVCENGRLVALELVGKSGKERVEADLFVDATGDGDLAAWAGCEVQMGRKEDGGCQPATTMFRMANVNRKIEYLEYDVPEEHNLPQGRVLLFGLPRKGEVVVNMTRVVNLNAVDSEALSLAEIEARQQIVLVVEYLRRHVQGFENAYFVQAATQIGVRESRRVIGEYVLTADDVLSGRKFDDAIAMCSYNIDIHNPKGKGTYLRGLKPGDWYEIPYRCVLPRGLENVLISGRCISSTHEAHSSLRIQPTCYAIGQAVGTAAALALKTGVAPKSIDVKQLQEQLYLIK